MSEAPDESGPIQRRPPRASDGGAPVSGALAIVLAVVAVVAGFLILKSISDGETSLGSTVPGVGGVDESGATTTIDPLTSAASTLAPATTLPPPVLIGASVLVANANGIGGSAAAMKNALEIAGFTMVPPVDAAAGNEELAASVVYFDPAVATNQAVADSVARAVGGASVVPLEGLPPVEGSSMNGAGVLLMLGIDKANKSLADLNPTAAATTITNPPVAGAETTTTTIA